MRWNCWQPGREQSRKYTANFDGKGKANPRGERIVVASTLEEWTCVLVWGQGDLRMCRWHRITFYILCVCVCGGGLHWMKWGAWIENVLHLGWWWFLVAWDSWKFRKESCRYHFKWGCGWIWSFYEDWGILFHSPTNLLIVIRTTTFSSGNFRS